ncbi:MAG TPA: pitrilysin family protein [Pyrinomonadaceae bacterium]|nr:pitrilysin family protein [Pyrinomonadaceae bacterium]
MRLHKKFLSATVLFALAGTALAQTGRSIHVDLKDTRLANGLRVITVEDHTAPVIAVAVTYNVGSRNEREGRTGFAHLFEHMMFQGSENVGKSEHFMLIQNNGGTMNGTTNEDRTNYFEALPSNQLALALYLESDRMRSLAVNQENLDNQRNVVQEERRIGLDNAAYGKSGEIQQELMYDNFAYKHDTIGSMTDLNAASVADVQAFFKMYYAPNNAVLTLVGDFKTADALATIKKYFENIPRQPDPPPVDMTEPEQKAERRTSVDDVLARALRVAIAYKTLPGNTADFYALQVLANALGGGGGFGGGGGGSSSRLYQKLVREKEMVTAINARAQENRGVGGFYLTATLRGNAKAADVEAAIYEEIARLQKEPIADWELQKAKNGARRNFINGLQSSLSRANSIGQYAVYYGDPNLINTRLDKVSAVTTADVQRVANKYLAPTNRTVVITVPKGGGRGGPQPGAMQPNVSQ